MLLLFLDGCKTSRITSLAPSVAPDTAVVDTVSKDTIVYYITQAGDTLQDLDDEVEIRIRRIRKDTISLAAVGDIMMGTNFPNAGYLPPDNGLGIWKTGQTLS